MKKIKRTIFRFIILFHTFGKTLSLIINTSEKGGRIVDPPGRSTLWLLGHPSAEMPSDLFSANCGGVQEQWIKNGGKCGFCGDPYEGPRDREFGGKYFSNVISRNVTQNTVINIIVETNKNPKGWFEFILFNEDRRDNSVQNSAFTEYKLQVPVVDRSRIRVSRSGIHMIPLKLPEDVMCQHCFIQWNFHTETLWGCEDVNDPTTCCVGCGPIQEEFYGCTDISIKAASNKEKTKTMSKAERSSYATWWCSRCEGEECNRPECYDVIHRRRMRRQALTCKPAGAYSNIAGMYGWCNSNCNNGIYSYCPATHCTCTAPTTTTSTTTTTTTTTTTPPTTTTSLTAPGIVRVLGSRGCEYCKSKNDQFCKQWYCYGYESLEASFQGSLTQKITELGDYFCTTCTESDTICKALFCAPDRVMVILGIQAKCSMCEKTNDTDCLSQPECTGLLTETLAKDSAPPADDTQATDDTDQLVSNSMQMDRIEVSSNNSRVFEPSSDQMSCRAIGQYKNISDWNTWCKKNCEHRDSCYSNQLPSICYCEDASLEVQRISAEICVANGAWKGSTAMDNWCATNCALNNCPISHCICTRAETNTTSTTVAPTSTTSTTTPSTTTTSTTTPSPTTTSTTTKSTTTTATTTTTSATTTSPTAATTRATTSPPKEADIYSLNAMNGILCDVCNSNGSLYSECSDNFCINYNSNIQYPSDPRDRVLTFSPELFCGYPGKDALFCNPDPIVRPYILSSTCAACIYLSPNQNCAFYCTS